MKLDELVSTLLDEMRKLSRTETVVGPAIEVGETRVVPVSELSVGFGTGTGEGQGDAKQKAAEGGVHGGGAGGVVQVNPMGFVVVNPDGRAQLHSLRQGRGQALAQVLDLIPKVGNELLNPQSKGDAKVAASAPTESGSSS